MKSAKILTLLVGFLFVGATAFGAPQFDVLEGTDQEIAQENSIALFTEVLKTADIGDMVKYDGDSAGFTLFIPQDRAMLNDLSEERRTELTTNKDAARYFVMFHMVDGKKTLEDLAAFDQKEVNSMSQTPLTFITVDSHSPETKSYILINGSKIMAGPFVGPNNVVIYILDNVVTP